MPQQTSHRMPTPQDTKLAALASEALAKAPRAHRALRLSIGAPGVAATTLELSPLVSRLLQEILRETAAGNAISVVPLEAELSTQQAAALLNVSRPHIVSLIESGVLPARKVGAHRRLPLADLLAYKAEKRARRLRTLSDLASYDRDLGLE